MPSSHDPAPAALLTAALPPSIRIRLVGGASRLAIATIMRRKDAARAMN